MKINKDLELFLRRLKVTQFCYGEKMHLVDLQNVLALNAMGHDAYFIITKRLPIEAIDNVSCCFVDLDAGRDSKKKYFSESIVISKKSKMLELIDSCPVYPHYIVETRNGYQLYWIITEYKINKNTLQYWNTVQYAIKDYFKPWADLKVGKINQIMRLPCTWWYKKSENKTKYYVDFDYIQRTKTFRKFNITYLYSKFVNKTLKVNNTVSKTANNNDINSAESEFDKFPSYKVYRKQYPERYPIPESTPTLDRNPIYTHTSYTHYTDIHNDKLLTIKKLLNKLLQIL
jgi:hypothetical protein